jgi:4,4'-diaponeurosporenoate glycosyltransferase
VDDASTDGTADVVEHFGARLIRVTEKPDGWLGKSWACQTGADAAGGQILLFLDADVRLRRDALSRLAAAYRQDGQTLSVQPFHEAIALYEQLSLFFNLIQIAANGTAVKSPVNLGLYGPVILISKEIYWEIGGHESVKDSIVEDMALGEQLRKRHIPYRLFVGDSGLSFRMCRVGLKTLPQARRKHLPGCFSPCFYGSPPPRPFRCISSAQFPFRHGGTLSFTVDYTSAGLPQSSRLCVASAGFSLSQRCSIHSRWLRFFRFS